VGRRAARILVNGPGRRKFPKKFSKNEEKKWSRFESSTIIFTLVQNKFQLSNKVRNLKNKRFRGGVAFSRILGRFVNSPFRQHACFATSANFVREWELL
jgi:hypothetical protein